jgi:hypothetical protein
VPYGDDEDFPHLKGIFDMAAVGTTAKTGENCPESGVWEVVSTPSTTAPIAKGNKMPPYSGNAVTWKLIKLA